MYWWWVFVVLSVVLCSFGVVVGDEVSFDDAGVVSVSAWWVRVCGEFVDYFFQGGGGKTPCCWIAGDG